MLVQMGAGVGLVVKGEEGVSTDGQRVCKRMKFFLNDMVLFKKKKIDHEGLHSEGLVGSEFSLIFPLALYPPAWN